MAVVLTEWTQQLAERWLIAYARCSYPLAYDERVHEMMRSQGDGSVPAWGEFRALLEGSEFERYLST